MALAPRAVPADDPIAKAIRDVRLADAVGKAGVKAPRPDGGMGGISSIVRVQADSEWVVVRRRGRFAAELEMLESPVHQAALVKTMCTAFVANIQKSHGYEYMNGIRWPDGSNGLKISDPLQHVEFENPTRIGWGELGALSMPEAPAAGFSEDVYRNYAEDCAKYEDAEKAKAARTMGTGPNDAWLVDFVIVGHFKHKVDPGYRVHVPFQHDAHAQMHGARRPSGLVAATR